MLNFIKTPFIVVGTMAAAGTYLVDSMQAVASEDHKWTIYHKMAR